MYRSLIAGLVMVLAGVAHADTTVFNIFGATSPGYITNSGDSVLGPGIESGTFSNGLSIAMGFTPSQSGAVTTVDIAFGRVHAGNYQLSIYNDNLGVPGDVLGTVTDTPPQFGQLDRHLVDFGKSVSLTAGQPYWLAASFGTSDWLAWNETTSSTTIPTARIPGPIGSGPWVKTPFSAGAFAVNVAVPDPACITGWPLVFVLHRRRRRRSCPKLRPQGDFRHAGCRADQNR